MLVNFNKIHLVYHELLKSKKWYDAVKKYKSSKIILYYGHGGNLGVTDHAAIDLTRLTKNKKIGFSLGSSIQTTSLINDDSFENLFKNWIAIHLESFKKNKKEICCIGVTSSGKSKNFHTALNFIKKNNLKSIYFTAVRLDKNEKFHTELYTDVNAYHESEVVSLALTYELIHSAGYYCPKIKK